MTVRRASLAAVFAVVVTVASALAIWSVALSAAGSQARPRRGVVVPQSRSAEQAAQTGVRVDPRRQWTPTGIIVSRGDRLSFQATGQVRPTRSAEVVGPQGGAGMSPNYPVPGAGGGALIARVGDSQPFLIGSRTDEIAMPADGELFLGVNDDLVADNSGAFVVRIGTADQALGTSGRWDTAPFGRATEAVTVPAKQAWTPTGIMVRAGDRVSFRVKGQVSWAQGPRDQTGPGGGPLDPMRQNDYPVPALGVGALVGRIDDGPAFAIGATAQAIVMPASGELVLGVNDDYFGDNTGQFTVLVERRNGR